MSKRIENHKPTPIASDDPPVLVMRKVYEEVHCVSGAPADNAMTHRVMSPVLHLPTVHVERTRSRNG